MSGYKGQCLPLWPLSSLIFKCGGTHRYDYRRPFSDLNQIGRPTDQSRALGPLTFSSPYPFFFLVKGLLTNPLLQSIVGRLNLV